MIVVEPLCGLGNRMRTLDSAISLARDLQRELHVVWPLRSSLACPFERLFELPSCIRSLTTITDWKVLRYVRVVGYRLRYAMYYHHRLISRLLKQKFSFQSASQYPSVAFRTFERFYSSPPGYRDFQPVQSLQRLIDRYRDSSRCVGVHIRRTDHLTSIEASPTVKFIECMRQEIDRAADTRFFVATDDPAEEATLEREFPGRIVTHRKQSLDRRDPRAIEDAVVDLYSLANCRKIIGSVFSSFSETAAEIGGIELQIAS